MSGQTPSDDKVSLIRMEFWICRSQVLEYLLTFLGFRPVLYIEILGTVICPNNLPKIVEANEYGVNFLNGY